MSLQIVQGTKTFGIGGELGDACASLATIKALGGGVCYAVNRPWTRPDWIGRSQALTRLAESQDYVTSFQPYRNEKLDVDLTNYRSAGQRFGVNIASRIANWARVSIPTTPWLTVEPSLATRGRIIVNRGPRWQGVNFPWKKLVDTFGKDMLYVGMDSDYKTFCEAFGAIKRHPTRDLLDVAEAIAGSELFIGSQSSPNAVCEGLKHPSVLEVCLTAVDCIYPNRDTIYSVDGSLDFEVLGKRFVSEPPVSSRSWRVLLNETELKCDDYAQLEKMARIQCVVQGIPIISKEEAQRLIQEHTNHSPYNNAMRWKSVQRRQDTVNIK